MKRVLCSIQVAGSVAALMAVLTSGVMDPAMAQREPPLGTFPLAVSESPFGPFGRSVTASFYADAPPRAVYDVLIDYAHMADFMSMVDEVKLVEARPRGARVSFRVRYLRVFDIVEIDERTYEPYRRITWHAVQGPLKVSDGSWTLTPQGKGTRIIYQTDIDPGIPVPSELTGMLMQRGMPEFLDGIRRRAESGGTWRKPK